jgi:hypothetical protein
MANSISRADLGHALQLGSRPLFYRDEFPRKLGESLVQVYNLSDGISHAMKCIKTTNTELQSVLWDMTSMSHILQRRVLKFDPLHFQDMLISILYRLLKLNPLSRSIEETEIDGVHVYCLGLLSFLSTILFNLGQRKKLPYDLLVGKLRHALMHMSGAASLDSSALL